MDEDLGGPPRESGRGGADDGLTGTDPDHDPQGVDRGDRRIGNRPGEPGYKDDSPGGIAGDREQLDLLADRQGMGRRRDDNLRDVSGWRGVGRVPGRGVASAGAQENPR